MAYVIVKLTISAFKLVFTLDSATSYLLYINFLDLALRYLVAFEKTMNFLNIHFHLLYDGLVLRAALTGYTDS